MPQRHVTGLGGVFLKGRDAEALRRWYADHLGLEPCADGSVVLGWRPLDRPDGIGQTVWHVFADESDYFEPSASRFMVNYRVADLDAALAALDAAGVERAGEPQDFEYGRFAWVLDPEGNKLELWEPPRGPAPFDVSVPAPSPTPDGARMLGARPNLTVRDVERALEVYRDVLGFSVATTMGEPPAFALLERDAAALALVRADQPVLSPVAALYLEVTDVAAIEARCAAAGLEVVVSLTTRPWGMTDFVVKDVDGHQIAIGQRTG